MKLAVSEEMYELLKWYRGGGMYELLKWYQSWGWLSWEDAEKNRPNPDKHRSIRGWYNSLSPEGKCVFQRFLNGDDSVIVVKTEPSPTIKDSLESITDKLNDISDVIKGVVENLEKEVIPDNDLKYIVKLVAYNDVNGDVSTKYVTSVVTFGEVTLSRWAHEAVVFRYKDDAVALTRDLNESLNKLGLAKNAQFTVEYLN